jgi:catechol 2,3-dioxygenase-like lactoylglutathione lyase family enzyme
MDEVTELRVSLTVRDLAGAVSLFRDALGLDTVLSWDEPTGAGVVLAAGRATLELVDEPQSRHIDQVERATAPSGPVRLALEVPDPEVAGRRLAPHADVGVAVDTPWGDRNVRVRTPHGIQLTLFTPTGPAGS